MLKLAVIGDPIAHSLSPEIHSAVFKYLGESCEYSLAHVKKGGLKDWVDLVKREGIDGFNVTMPHKTDILAFLDELDNDRYDAVNTVKVENGRLKGYNTDGRGFIMSIEEHGAVVKGKRVLIAGKGGASRILAAAVAIEGAESVTALGRGELKDISSYAEEADIFINATPLGMHGIDDDWSDLGFADKLPQHCVVADLIYKPPKTSLLRRAEERGLTAVNGLGMLIYQAIIADAIYLGRELDIRDIRNNAGFGM